jgi:hypothetical protein
LLIDRKIIKIKLYKYFSDGAVYLDKEIFLFQDWVIRWSGMIKASDVVMCIIYCDIIMDLFQFLVTLYLKLFNRFEPNFLWCIFMEVNQCVLSRFCDFIIFDLFMALCFVISHMLYIEKYPSMHKSSDISQDISTNFVSQS